MARSRVSLRHVFSSVATALGALTLFVGTSVAPAYGQAAASAPTYTQGTTSATSTTSAPIATSPTTATNTTSATIKISIDTPTIGQTVKGGEQISFGGWAVDSSGTGGVIETVVVFADGHPGEGGVRLGEADYGVSRPDVAAVLGNPAYTDVGFNLNWKVAGEAGVRTLYIYAFSSEHGWGYQPITLNVDGATAMSGSESANTGDGSQTQGSQYPYSTTTGTGYTGQGAQVNPAYYQNQNYGAATNPYGTANTGYPNQVGTQYGYTDPYGNASGVPAGYAGGYVAGQPYANTNPYAPTGQYPGAGMNPYGNSYPGANPYAPGAQYPNGSPYAPGYPQNPGYPYGAY